jgi:DNA topoisomerase-3
METAGRKLDDTSLIEALRESGLGTPATRAATIETLLTRQYIVRTAKNLSSTPTGQALIAAVHPLVRSAEMTGAWELRLRRMERGEERYGPFMQQIARYVREVVGHEAIKPAAPRQPSARAAQSAKSTRRSPRELHARAHSSKRRTLASGRACAIKERR